MRLRQKVKKNTDPHTVDTDFETLQPDLLASDNMKTNDEARNFCDVDWNNILNSDESNDILTRSKSRPFNFLITYHQKVERFVLNKNYFDLKSRTDTQEWLIAYNKETSKLSEIGKMKIVKKSKGIQVLPLLELFVRK